MNSNEDLLAQVAEKSRFLVRVMVLAMCGWFYSFSIKLATNETGFELARNVAR